LEIFFLTFTNSIDIKIYGCFLILITLIKNCIDMNHLLFLNLGAGEIVPIVLIILLLFGGKKSLN
jgi:hypothetical protein